MTPMSRSSPHVPWTDAIARQLEEDIAFRTSSTDTQASNTKKGVDEKLTFLPSLSVDLSKLAEALYVAGRSEGMVLATLQRAHRSYLEYCDLVGDRVRTMGDAESSRINSAYLQNALFNALLTKDMSAAVRLSEVAEGLLANGGRDYGAEFKGLLQGLRWALRSEPAKAAGAVQEASGGKSGAWSIYLVEVLSKKSRLKFESLKGPLDHPLGAYAAGDLGAFTKCLQSMCDALDLYARETVAKRKVDDIAIAQTMTWSREATAYLALGRLKGWDLAIEHYSLGRTLLDASPAA